MYIDKINELEPTRDQLQKWTETRALTIHAAAAFAHIFFTMMGKGKNGRMATFTDSIPTAATDGKNLLVNPSWFFSMELKERLFVTVHEIMHNVLGHPHLMQTWEKQQCVITSSGKRLPWKPEIMNIAMDLIINHTLVEAKIGVMPSSGWLDDSLGKGTDSCVDVYERLMSKSKDGFKVRKPKGGKDGTGGGGFDQLLKPGTGDPKDADGKPAGSTERDDRAWKQATAAALESARLQGNLPSCLERLLSEVTEPKVDWREHLRGVFSRMFGHERYDFARPNRRFIVRDIYVPSTKATRAGDVVVAIDTSGSCVDILPMFLNELSGILGDVRPERVILMWCDAAIQRVDELDDADQIAGLKGFYGGGTDFRPVFKEVEQRGLEPDALVYLTDMYGDAPSVAPSYPVVWASITKDYRPVKWGQYVEIDASI
jgi:predicted metal-dependent peptidase